MRSHRRSQETRRGRRARIDLDAKTLEYLEFQKITARLADHCAFSGGRRLALALAPSGDVDEVRRRQQLTAEARALRRLKPHFRPGHATDITPHVQTAARAGVLAPIDLLETLAFLQQAQQIRNHLVPLAAQVPLLSAIAGRIGEFKPLIGEFSRALGPRGEILDDASDELPALRRNVALTHDRLLDRVQRILNHALADGVAQEPIVTERDGRYVIPIKADARGQLPGVIHDLSSSGATVFVEPLAAVELGNAWREAQLQEHREIERILRRLSALLGEQAGPVLAAIAAAGEIDFALAKAAFAEAIDASLPQPGGALAWLVEAPDELRLQSARHPLLPREAVPISIMVGGSHRSVLITGPNTGGKTVALKTVGLLTLMAQAGLPIPAEIGTQIPVYTGVFADIGDEQSIEQSLSTFSSHMRNIIRILSEAGPQSLALLDELGAGTDPSEGALLGRAILRHLLTAGASVVATTHHGELKIFAHETPGLINASVEFDEITLAPTFRLAMGLPGRSNALAIAERLGMPASVLADARASVAPGAQSVERLLEELQRERSAAGDERRAEEYARRESEEVRRQLGDRLDRLDDERGRVLAKTEQEMEQELAAFRRAIQEGERRLLQGRKEDLTTARARSERAQERVAAVRDEQARRRRPAAVPAAPIDPQAIRPGVVLFLRGLEQAGEALTPVDAEGMVSVQIGSLRTRVRHEQIERLGRREERASAGRLPGAVSNPEARIEVRGQTLDEALPAVERFLDQAYRGGLARVEVVHGKGTGVLRTAVRELLRGHPLVSTYNSALREEGGEGVTIAHLAI